MMTEEQLERELWGLLFQHFQDEKHNWSGTCAEFGLTLPQAHLLRYLTAGTLVKMNGLAGALDLLNQGLGGGGLLGGFAAGAERAGPQHENTCAGAEVV